MKHFFSKHDSRFFSALALAGIIVSLALLLPMVRDALIAFGATRISEKVFENTSYWQLKFFGFGVSVLVVLGTFLFTQSRKFDALLDDAQKQARRTDALLACVCVAFTSLCVALALFTKATWMDECITMATIQHPFSELISIQQSDVHPPLYFFYTKLWATVFGHSFFSLRLASIAPVVATLLSVVLFLRKEFGGKTALIFAAAFGSSFAVLSYSKEIRMYGVALFFVAMIAISAWYFIKRERIVLPAITFLLASLGAAYTHYYAAVLAGIGFALLFLYVLKNDRRKIKTLLPVAVAAILFYLPWVPTVLSVTANVSKDFWIHKMTPRMAAELYVFLFESGDRSATLLVLGLFLCSICLFLRGKKEKEDWFAFGAFASILLLATAGVAHDLAAHQSLFVKRYLLPGTVLVWLFFAIQGRRVKNARALVLLLSLFVAAGVMSTARIIYEEGSKNKTRDLIFGVLEKRAGTGDVFILPDKLHEMVHWRTMLVSLFPGHTHILETDEGFHTIGGPTDERASRRLFRPRFVKYTDDSVRSGDTGRAPAWIILEEKSALQREFLATYGGRAEVCSTNGTFALYRLNEAKEILAFFEKHNNLRG